MQTTSTLVQWGNLTLVLNLPAFEEGYTQGRQYYFEDAWEEPGESGIQEPLTASHLLGLIATRDRDGHYQLDDGCGKSTFFKGIEELLGVLVGYLSGPLHPETQEESARRLASCLVIEE